MTFVHDVQKLEGFPDGRPETGPMQFGDDWPGVFIRGDNALMDATAVDQAIALLPQDAWSVRAMLLGLRDTLRSCSVGDTGWPPARAEQKADDQTTEFMTVTVKRPPKGFKIYKVMALDQHPERKHLCLDCEILAAFPRTFDPTPTR